MHLHYFVVYIFDDVKTDLSTHGLRNNYLLAFRTDQRYFRALQISTMEFFEKN